MSKYNPPALSTGFSENGKSAKKRFDNILNTKSKKTGLFAFVLILALVGIAGVWFGFKSNHNIVYVCNTFDCSFKLPRSWENKYEIEEHNKKAVYVYHKAIREKYGQGTGLMFYIEMLQGDDLTHEQITDPGNRSIALQENGCTYVFGMPTDVQYPIWEGGDKRMAEDYVKLTKDNDKIKQSISRAAVSGFGRAPGSAVLIKDASLFGDAQGKSVAAGLRKNDLVYVVYDQNDDFYYIQLAVMVHPPVEGYIAKENVSFDKAQLQRASYGCIPSGNIYKSPGEKDIYINNYTGVFAIAERKGEWTRVNLTGGDDGKWVKTADISYDIPPSNIDLSYTNLQKETDNGQSLWRLDAADTARDYLYNTLKKSGGAFAVTYSDNESCTVTYTDDSGKDSVIHLYKPVKKDRSGIWIISKNTIMEQKIREVIPPDGQLQVNSGMGWRININQDIMDSLPEGKTGFTLADIEKVLEINVSHYFDKDLDVMVYYVETGAKSSTPFIFVFDNAELISYYDLQTPANEKAARDILISLDKYKRFQ